jgi:hypothetical protein
VKLATHKTVEASREPFCLLTINGGSSSIRFSVYEAGETPRRSLDGKVDRIGLSGTNLAVNDSAGRPQVPLRLAADDHRTAVGFLLDWPEAQPVLASVKAAGHRVVHGVKHSEPERVTPKLLAELHRRAALVPVVEPEVLMDGEHTLGRCSEVTEEVLRSVFNQLYEQRVLLEGILLKPNMVLSGLTCPRQSGIDEVADVTVRCLLRSVPAAVPGIAFLSGGQSAELASARLNAMNVRYKSRVPWALAFSFARAIQQPALEIWSGDEANLEAAQQALLHRARCNQAARRGEYDAAMDGVRV